MAEIRISSPASTVGIIVPYKTYIYVAFKTVVRESLTIAGNRLELLVPKLRLLLNDTDKEKINRYLLHLPTSFAPVVREFEAIPISISLSFFSPTVESGIDRVREFYTEVLHVVLPYYRDPNFIATLTNELNKRDFMYVFDDPITLPSLEPSQIYVPTYTVNLFHSGEYAISKRKTPYGILVIDSSAEALE